MKIFTFALLSISCVFAPVNIALAQVTLPFPVFVDGTVIEASQMNANNAALSSQALNRTGGTMSGTLTVLSIVPAVHDTYDLGTTGTRFQDLFLSGVLNATGNVTLGGTLTVTGASTLNSTLAVTSWATVGSTLAVTGATTLNSTLQVVGEVLFNGVSTLTGATTLNSTLTVTGATTLNSTLTAGGATTFNSTATANGNFFVSGTDPILEMVDSDGGAEAKRWRWQAGTNVLALSTANDADSVTSGAMAFTRSGNTISTIGFYTAGAEVVRIAAGSIFVGDTSNAEQTLGLTMRETSFASAREIVSLKNTEVAHGLSATETDTFMALSVLASTGGLLTEAFAEAAATAVYRVDAQAANGSGSTTKSTAADGFLAFRAFENSSNVGADENLLIIANATSTKFIFDAEGDAHNDGTTWTAYDSFDDLSLVETLDHVLDPTLRALDRIDLDASRSWLTEARLVSFDAEGRPFVNSSRIQMLHNGALRQMADRVVTLEGQLEQMRVELALLKGRQ